MNRQLEARAADWLARLQREDISTEERADLERWLSDDPAHAVAFARAESAWERAERLQALPAPRFAERSAQRGRFWALAAGFGAVTAGAALWYFMTQWNVYSTAVGERRTVALNDGSQVSLNTASRLEVDFDGTTRAIRLVEGEALFKVTRDARRPFIVWAGETSVRALGTAFNVKMHNQVVEVTVTEGAVAVDDKSRLDAGTVAVAAAGAVNRVALTEEAIKRRIAWREGVIELKGETLEQAVEEFNRYRKSRLIVADPALATLRVGGRFETDEADKFINALKANFAVRAVEGEGGNLYLLGSEAEPGGSRP